MRTFLTRNVNGAFVAGINLIHIEGATQDSRAGRVKVCPYPVTTVYGKPQERVLFRADRDANPFFHLFESLWMLAGRCDAHWLDQFVHDFASRFAEEDGIQHGAYGYRWRNHFFDYGNGSRRDQLSILIDLLRQNPDDRRAVLTMWDPRVDLAADKRDIPCNTHIYLRVRPHLAGSVLDITVCCRSNDAIWGAYGANAVHFSILQEYLAARIGVGMGVYYQISNNFHAYEDVLNKFSLPIKVEDQYTTSNIPVFPLVSHPDYFDSDVRAFVNADTISFSNEFFPKIAVPLLAAYKLWKSRHKTKALEAVKTMPYCDWTVAAGQWMQRRIDKAKQLRDH